MKTKKNGFTLIEMVAGLAIFLIISVAIMSLIMTTFTHNSLNKKTFDANSMSKVFYETLRNNRPSTLDKENPYNVNESTKERYVYIAFDDKEDLIDAMQDKFFKKVISNNTQKINESNYIFGKSSKLEGFNELKLKDGVSTKKYLINIYVKKNEDKKVYEFTTTVWSIQKGEISAVERKSLISSES